MIKLATNNIRNILHLRLTSIKVSTLPIVQKTRVKFKGNQFSRLHEFYTLIIHATKERKKKKKEIMVFELEESKKRYSYRSTGHKLAPIDLENNTITRQEHVSSNVCQGAIARQGSSPCQPLLYGTRLTIT